MVFNQKTNDTYKNYFLRNGKNNDYEYFNWQILDVEWCCCYFFVMISFHLLVYNSRENNSWHLDKLNSRLRKQTQQLRRHSQPQLFTMNIKWTLDAELQSTQSYCSWSSSARLLKSIYYYGNGEEESNRSININRKGERIL